MGPSMKPQISRRSGRTDQNLQKHSAKEACDTHSSARLLYSSSKCVSGGRRAEEALLLPPSHVRGNRAKRRSCVVAERLLFEVTIVVGLVRRSLARRCAVNIGSVQACTCYCAQFLCRVLASCPDMATASENMLR